MIRIAMIGSGYVGLVSGTCFSDFGFSVICMDKNEEMIHNLSQGIPPMYEPGLDMMMEKNLYYKRLRFTTSLEEAVDQADIIFIAVGTPSLDDGDSDISGVLEVAAQIGQVMKEYKIIVDKSTVPVGTGRKVKQIIRQQLEDRGVQTDFDVVSNPEFLRQGSAIQDFTHADRVIIGAESERAVEVMKEAYRVLYINETPFLIVNLETAEMIKYAANSFLATKISFINEISELCEKVGANVQQVAKGMGMDGRIGAKFLHTGPGYGGSCFPKDTRAFLKTGQSYDCKMGIIRSTIEANDNQKKRMVEKVRQTMGNLQGKKIAVLGLAFKNNTDDIRESPSIFMMDALSQEGLTFQVYDPKAMPKTKAKFADGGISIRFCEDEYEACIDADAVLLITEWNQFRSLDMERIKNSMADDFFFDFRNIYSPETMTKQGFKYFSVGRGESLHNE